MSSMAEEPRIDEEPTVPSWLRKTAKAEPAEPPWIPQVGDVIEGKFKVLQKVGEGGVGIVYQATDMDLGRYVAVKFMNVAGKENLFEREAQATARVEHPNAIKIHQFGRARGTPYLVLEWLNGSTLNANLRRNATSIKEALRIMICVTDVLACAHEHGVIHRDLSSNNIFLTFEGVVKVLDFGLAAYDPATRAHWRGLKNLAEAVSVCERLSEIQTDRKGLNGDDSADLMYYLPQILDTSTDSSCGGTPGFIAPEQLRNSLATTQSDIWSAGVLLFLLVAHRMPYSTNSMREYVEQVQYQVAPRLREYAPHAPASLESLVGRMLMCEPDARPTAEQGRDELRTILEDLNALEMENQRRAIFAVLTSRQQEIAILLVETDYSGKAIAEEIGISSATIRTHTENIYRLLKVKSRPELVQYYQKHIQRLSRT